MKQIKLIMVMMILSLNQLFAQTEREVVSDSASGSRLNLGKIDPYWLTVTYDKTTHIIFPSKIKYVDLGSEHLIAGKADEAENVLRIKAASKNFQPETNFSVVTEDGKFYTFDVFYSDYPESLSYDVLKMQRAGIKSNSDNVMLEDLSGDQAPLVEAGLKTIYQHNKRVIRHIASENYGITFQLKSIYIGEGKFYFHLELRNTSNVSYPIDYISFKIVDRKTAKRTAVQEKDLVPLRMFLPLDPVPANGVERNVFLLNQFTLADDKMLVIDVFEANGGRHQHIEIQNEDLIRAKPLSGLKLIF
ncbi:conjugative transposon protein TraN [Pedobacter sp. KLB.chiD]|uniref:conjugative transposon protein TraN n=1 Tax=Pedobacter sp. KLB.chiD TaxID=3387402 RepID=UPI003999C0F1